MKLYNSEQARVVDIKATKNLGIPSIVLMEHAASSVLEELENILDSVSEHRFVVLAGNGNNGGDALALARMLFLKGAKVFVNTPLGKPKTKDAITEQKILKNMKNSVIYLKKEELKKYIDEKTIVIDGVFGTGYKKQKKQNKDLIKVFSIAEKAPYIVALDVPSGVDASTGEAESWALTADLTISFAVPKIGTYVSPGAVHSGIVLIKDIHTEKPLMHTPYELIDERIIEGVLKKLKRPKNSHKGSFGHLAILVPEKGMEGAVTMASSSALMSGVGLVSVLTINESVTELRKRMPKLMPEVMVKGFVPDNLKNYDAVLCGPGFGKEGIRELKLIIENTKTKLILDADALNIISEQKELLKALGSKKEVLLTPHPGEMARLCNISNIQEQRLNITRLFVSQNNINVLLKGYMSLLADKEGKIFINPTGNPGLAKAGTGDVLSGLIASFSAQGLELVEAGLLGAYLHGLCADKLVKDEKSMLSITATDIIKEIGTVLKCLMKDI